VTNVFDCCISVCPLAYLGNHTAELYQIFVHGDRGRESVLLVSFCDVLRTSGFEDDVMFSHIGFCGASRVYCLAARA